MDLSKWAEFPTANHAQYNAETSTTNTEQIDSLLTEWSPLTEIENVPNKFEEINDDSTIGINLIQPVPIDIFNYINENSNLPAESIILPNVEPIWHTGEEMVEILETLNNHREGTMNQRYRRSLDKNLDYVGFVEHLPLSEKFYRHPNLSYEEQQKQLNNVSLVERRNMNSESTRNAFDLSKSKATVEFSKHNYVPVFPSCNDTENLKADYANRTARRNLKNYDRLRDNEKQISTGMQKYRNVENRRNETSKDMNKSQSSIKQRRRDKSYINIRDHQKNAENTTSSDIPEYDPNKIPYVDVPDYSDIREESLDEEDRKVNPRTENKIEEKEVDFVNSEKSTDLKKSSKSEENKKDRLSNDSEKNVSKENDSNVTDLKKHKSETSINPEKPSKSSNINKSEEKSKNTLEKGSEQNTDTKSNSKPSNFKSGESEILTNFKMIFKPLKIEESEGKDKDKSSRGSNQTPSSNFSEQKSENNSQEDSMETQQKQEDAVSQSGPIIFDINEYRKPFNLDEFLKDDPIMKKLKLLEKETRTNYGQNGKRVPGGFNESNNAYRGRVKAQDDSVDVRDTFDDLSKSHQSSDFTDISTKIDRNEGRKNQQDSDEQKSDEDFLKFAFKRDEENDPTSQSNHEEEFLSRYFTDDAIKNLHEDGKIEEDRDRKDTKRKEDTYNALSTIMSKKSHVSRLDKDIDGRIKARDEPALRYKNFWSLEYKSPRKRVDMEAQERRK
ncbi:hypothetical protein ANTPLA_LOCUS10822 [Anthophora plagiata]